MVPLVRLLAPASVAVALVLPSGCGDDGSDEAVGTSERSDTAPEEPGRYCDLVAAYDEATNVDVSSVESTLQGFEAIAEAARAVVAEAPAEVHDAHEQLAVGAERMVARLREAGPTTMDELSAFGEQVTAELEAEMGDLEAETEAVTTFAEQECGVTFG